MAHANESPVSKVDSGGFNRAPWPDETPLTGGSGVCSDPTCSKCGDGKSRPLSIGWESVRCTGPHSVPHLRNLLPGGRGTGGSVLVVHPDLHLEIEDVYHRGSYTRSKVSIGSGSGR